MWFDFQIWLFNNQWFGVTVFYSLVGMTLALVGILWRDVSRLIDLITENY